jgi:putative transposase
LPAVSGADHYEQQYRARVIKQLHRRAAQFPTESWFNSFKNERIHGVRYASHAEMKATSFEYIEVFYNRKRQHSTLGYRSPIQHLNHWIREQNQEQRAA